jgi:hypothetical protein
MEIHEEIKKGSYIIYLLKTGYNKDMLIFWSVKYGIARALRLFTLNLSSLNSFLINNCIS